MNANSALDDSRRSSAESQSSNGTATSNRSNRSGATATSSSSTQQQKRKMRPSTAPVKNVKAQHSTSSSHRASTAPISSNNTINNTTDDAASAASNVRVVARLRPLSTKERNEHSNESIRANVHSSSIAVPDHHNDTGNNNNTRKFEFDAVFPPNSSQEQVYQTTCGDMISKSIFRGFNATILAYGQTGSGKTYTMGTDYSSSSDGDDSGKPIAASNINNKSSSSSSSLAPPAKSEGVIGRAVHDLFSTRNSLPNGRNRVKVEMSYLEIYNEQAIDLLSDDPSDASLLQVRDSKSEGVVVQNLNSFIVSSPREVAALMEKAGAKRATGSTQMNSVSSRSHAICTLTVTIAPLESSDGGSGSNNNETSSSSPRNHAMRAKLTLVDLAGSERIKRTGAEGARMKEGININKGECFLV
eukprot:scaffold1006_cov114-Skeletonema_dohrnii-CCMP3373.AAC.4